VSNQTLSEIRKIVRAVKILSPTSFSFAGQVVTQSPVAHQHLVAGTEGDLIGLLTQHIYLYCFCHKFSGDTHKEFPPTLPDDAFTQTLIDSNASSERWDAGWQITQVLPSGQVMAHKSGQSRALWAGEFITHDGPGMAPRQGANISVFLQKGTKSLQPGFYIAFGEFMHDEPDDWNLVRFYWNIKAAGAADLMRLITTSLNRFQVPFRFKCVTNRESYSRLDSAVLYINKRFYRITAEIVSDVYKKIKASLLQDTPIFTKRLGHGLALAEDPGQQDSFGTSRCRILAEAIINSHNSSNGQDKSEHVKVQDIVNEFERRGFNVDHLYLNAGSNDLYVFPNSHS